MVEAYPAISIGLLVCSMFLIGVLYEHPIRRLMVRAITGTLCLAVINLVVTTEHQIEFGGVQMGIVTFLGVPGAIALYILQILMS